MRKILVSQFLTLDGVMEAPEKWNANYLNDAELVNEILTDIAASDSLLFGRTSYEFFAARWPSRTGELADKLNTLPKLVVSTTLQKAEWHNSTIINANASDEIKKMKYQMGKNILVFGSYKLIQTLINDKLIDEYKLFVYPLTFGTGKHLFEQGATGQTLKLVALKSLATGVVAMTYQTEINLLGDNQTK